MYKYAYSKLNDVDEISFLKYKLKNIKKLSSKWIFQ